MRRPAGFAATQFAGDQVSLFTACPGSELRAIATVCLALMIDQAVRAELGER